MKKQWMLHAVISSITAVMYGGAEVSAQEIDVLYTNAPNGSTVSVPSNISEVNSGTNEIAVGIVFDGDNVDSSTGTLAGGGSVTVRNTATADEAGASILCAIAAGGGVTNLESRAVTVVNDQRAYVGESTNSTQAIAYYGDQVGDVDDAISVSAYSGTISSIANEAVAAAEAIGFAEGEFGNGGSVYGDINGSMTILAQAGSAASVSNDADADAEAIGVSEELDGDLTGSITALAYGGSAAAEGTGDASAEADSEGVYDINGDLTGTVTAEAYGGEAVSAAGSAYADADVEAVYHNVYGVLSGTVRAYAVGGQATGNYANAGAEADGVYYNVYSNMTGTVIAEAVGGTANSSNSSAYADAEAVGVDDDIEGEMSGAISAVASGGTAVSQNSSAYADAEAEGLDDDIEGDLTGTITVLATGGSAQGNYANAGAEANGVSDLEGRLIGSMTVSAYGGTAVSSNNSAYADVYAEGVEGSVDDDLSGTLTVFAQGGSAASSNSYACADAGAYGVDGSIYSNMTGIINASAVGGTAVGYYADAEADAYGAGDIYSNMTGTINVSAVAGTALADGSSAYAEAYAEGVSGDIEGEFSGTITAAAYGGSASSSSSSAYAGVEAYGVYDTVEGVMDGTISVKAVGGEVTAADYAENEVKAHGIHYGVESNLTGTISVKAYGGTVTSTEGDAYIAIRAKGVGYDGIGGDLAGSIMVYAEGGSAAAADYTEIDMKVIGVDYDIEGDLDGSISVTSIGGTLYGASAYSVTRGHGVRESGGGGDIYGDLNGTVSVNVQGADLTATNGYAYTETYARGVLDDIYGDVSSSGEISVTARGGTVEAVNGDAYSYSEATGNYGGIDGLMAGSISAAAYGGSAQGDDGAYASASADGSGGIEAGLTGTVTAKAYAGTAASTGGGWVSANAYADGVDGSVGGDFSGTVTAYAEGGTAEVTSGGSAEASASAYGVDGSVEGSFSGRIIAAAVGGTATASSGYDADASAEAYGIDGYNVAVSNFTGTIIATANPGDEIVNGTNRTATGTAVGVAAYSSLYLDASGGSILAYVLGEGTTNDTALAVQGGYGDDTVLLSDMLLAGGIDLNGGTNSLTILGDTSVSGDILSTGGWMDLSIENGELGFYGGFSRIDITGSMNVSSNGGLGIVLSASETNRAAVSIDGVLTVEEGATLAAQPAAGESGAGIIGESFEAVTATNDLTAQATFVEAADSLFSMDITNIANSVYVTPTALKVQDTPAPSAIYASVSSLKAVMQSLSARLGGRRIEVADAARRPTGAAGPEGDAAWELFVRQFNDIGGLDSDGARAGYDWTTHGFSVGAEKTAGENLLFGFTGSGAWTDLDGEQNSGGGDSQMLVLAAYGTWFKDQWYSELGLGFGKAWNEAQRNDILGDSYEGEYDSALVGMWLEGGYAFEMAESFELEPYGRMAYVHGEHDGYTESGTGAAPMTVADSSSDNLPTELGVRGTKEWSRESGARFSLALSAGWSHEWIDENISVNTSILGISQTATTPDADADALVLGIDGDWYFNEAWNIGLEYAPTFSGNWQNHSVNGTLTCRF